MAIRKSKEESFEMCGDLKDVTKRCEEALKLGGFSDVMVNPAISQLTANYKKLMTWGYIDITLTSTQSQYIKVHVVSTANADNIYALFRSPNRIILEAFKSNLR